MVLWQYLACSRQGSKNFIPGHTSQSTEVSVKKRRCRSFRCECLAKLNLRYFSDGMSRGCEVYQFVEYHNHLMVANEHRHFMMANRSLDPIHQRFMEDCGRCNIGSTLTFKLLKEIMGGPENVGYAQMIFDYMRSQKESSDAFYYEIEIGSHGKYCMIFAPFTGKDNHSRAVTFGAGLLSSEAPKLIITDQDCGIKLVVQQVLLQTRHRWCMWHIMVKVSDKLPKSLLGNEDFKKELNACVWSDLLEPDEFDIIWNDIMERTTSMSESENSFFKNYTKPRANLVQFINFFNCAVGDQRNANSRLNYLDYSTIPDLSTQLPIEKHASTIYIDSFFKHVQQEISMNKSANIIPSEEQQPSEKYFGRRWLKSSLLKAAHGLPSEEQQPFEHLDEKQEVKKKLFTNFYQLVQKSEGSMDHLSLLCAGLDDLEEHIF
ncbi:protein FAR1-RELATED SEQUENCE 5-like [Salvia splendens]|uniref:protein FAR1-RELATED SEQUENCE 5-like n=1 Tax=Salvia splendens TaxID=180675 RepID=UPI001C2576BA|nr:protein FAR1-RELATED SEQUENCE 5-like [Salvia splendens]